MDLREIPTTGTFQRHPWDRARARFFLQTLEAAGLLSRPLEVLDVGAGDAYFAGELARRLPEGSRVVCCDSNYTPEHLARIAGTVDGRLISFTRELPAGRFGLVALLDVIEHVPDDVGFLRMLAEQHLAPGGSVLISVPAWMSLFTRHDLGVAHYRRYRPGQLAEAVRGAGLAVARSGGLFHSLLLPRALQKLGERARGIRSAPAPETAPDHANSDIAAWKGGPVVTRAVDLALAADNAVSRASAAMKLPLPGLSAWVLATTPS
jgi:SAM-dependent methyltransferase